ncbi:atp-dependent DNA helicase q-like 4a [Anaeramoeba flamelloides]|uniref:ATP-dependent DNA helicase n=1 Tax=Anaeramoeba flamelloides TaxID=1746091 RepID=A0AAV7ZTD8_9EUKA|nr:atp-dependent DNA helicase q-like 4a [Anaeramoeba flamelloides]KAJ6226508.1 atp-dependent DNA helicase q-like 4a [Anaeramoeba flamelloides]
MSYFKPNVQTTNQTNNQNSSMKTVNENNLKFLDPTDLFSKNNYPWSSQSKLLLNAIFGISSYRTNQLPAINCTLCGNDTFLIMPTGGGKTLTYLLPSLISKGTTIVISPLLSLIEDQLRVLKNLNIPATSLSVLSSSSLTAPSYEEIMEMKQGRTTYKLIYVTPEKINNSQMIVQILENLQKKGNLARFVIDEVHCVSQWGHDFRPDYIKLGKLKRLFPKIPFLLLTATATTKVKNDVKTILQLEKCYLFTQSSNRTNLLYEVRQKKQFKNIHIQISKFVKKFYPNDSGIIYCLSRRDCELLNTNLVKSGISSGTYHAGMDINQRKKIQDSWTNDKTRVIVATIAFGVGINKPDVRFVIHSSIPKSFENLIQESGRAGRDGEQAHCIVYYNPNDTVRLRRLFQYSAYQNTQTQLSNKKKLDLIVSYCENIIDCRRKLLLEYLGEEFDPIHCNKTCDNCKRQSIHDIIQKDYTEPSKHFVSVIKQCPSISKTYIFSILHGTDIERLKIKGYTSNKITSFGVFKTSYPKELLERLLQKLLEEEIISKQLINVERIDRKSYFVYSVGKNADSLLNGQKKITLPITRIKRKEKSGFQIDTNSKILSIKKQPQTKDQNLITNNIKNKSKSNNTQQNTKSTLTGGLNWSFDSQFLSSSNRDRKRKHFGSRSSEIKTIISTNENKNKNKNQNDNNIKNNVNSNVVNLNEIQNKSTKTENTQDFNEELLTIREMIENLDLSISSKTYEDLLFDNLNKENKQQSISNNNLLENINSPSKKIISINPEQNIQITKDPLYKKLQILCSELAQKLNCSSYHIFGNSLLKKIAILKPQNLLEFQQIEGVGKIKALRWGETFVTCIKKYTKKN